MASIIPCSSRNSERWKPSGSFWRMVCSMTRGPGEADQRLGLGEDDVAQPGEGGRHAAGGGVEQHRDVRLAAVAEAGDAPRRSSPSASARRCPPACARRRRRRTRSPGTCSSCARSKTRVTFSPTTEPIEPPMNSKTKQPTETWWPSMRPTPEMNASFSPSVLARGLQRGPCTSWSRRSRAGPAAPAPCRTPRSCPGPARPRAGRAPARAGGGRSAGRRSSSSRAPAGR